MTSRKSKSSSFSAFSLYYWIRRAIDYRAGLYDLKHWQKGWILSYQYDGVLNPAWHGRPCVLIKPGTGVTNSLVTGQQSIFENNSWEKKFTSTALCLLFLFYLIQGSRYMRARNYNGARNWQLVQAHLLRLLHTTKKWEKLAPAPRLTVVFVVFDTELVARTFTCNAVPFRAGLFT